MEQGYLAVITFVKYTTHQSRQRRRTYFLSRRSATHLVDCYELKRLLRLRLTKWDNLTFL